MIEPLTYEQKVDVAFTSARQYHADPRLEEVVTHCGTRAVDCTFRGNNDSTCYVHVDADGLSGPVVNYSWRWKGSQDGPSIPWPMDLTFNEAVNLYGEEYPSLPYSYCVLCAPSTAMRRDPEFRFSTGIGNVIVDVPGRYAIPEINSQAMRRMNKAVCDI